jgi:MSHA biogenesis protein MshQ
MKNYQGVFAKITSAIPSGSGAFTANLLPKNNVNSLTSLATWAAGSWSTLTNAYNLLYSFGADDRFTFTKTNTNQVTPFETSLTISALADSDGVSASSLPLNLWPVAPDASAFKVYSGRLTLDSVNAAETSALTQPFYMQYWNGSAYALNTADNCSSLNSTYLQMNAAANWSGINLRTSNSSSASATTNASLSPAIMAQGAGAILFAAPNNTGWVDISASSSLPLWMQDLSLSSGLAPARASFGYYRGNDRLIYRREVFGGQ